MNFEEEQRKKREEALQQNAALIIQQQWRAHLLRLEEFTETTKVDSNITAAAAAAADAAGGFGDDAVAEAAALSPEERREALLDEYRKLLAEREATVEQNLAYQRVLAKHFAEQRSRKGEDGTTHMLTPEAEQQYWATVRQVGEERRRVARKRAAAEDDLERQRMNHQDTIDSAFMQEHNFRQYIKETAGRAIFMRSSHSIPVVDVDAFLEKEESQRNQIQSSRIRYLQLRNYAKKLRRNADDKDKHNDGMYLIDFEQLKIENTNLNEKIEERNEDLVKLRRKVTTTIHVLTHVKEKLEFMKGENAQLRQQVASTETELNGVRDTLAQTKRRRDGYARANLRMREKMPLVGSEDLLMDYEKRKTTINETRMRVVELTDKHKHMMTYIREQQPVIDSLSNALSHYPA